MKIKITSLFLFLLCLLIWWPTVAWTGTLGPSNFRYSANLDGEIRKGGFYRVVLPAGILEGSERSCRDLRIFDKENREIPFVILDNRIPPKKTIRYPLEVISYEEQAARTKILLKRPNPTDPVTRLEMDSLDRDFNKAVIVSGSRDMKNWKSLGHDDLYDFSSRVNLRKMHLPLQKNTYPYFQLVIDEGKAKGNLQNIRLKFDGMDFSASTYTRKKLQISRFVVLDDTEDRENVTYDALKLKPTVSADTTKRVSEIAFNSALPFSTVEFVIDNPYYYRPLTLYGTKTGRKEDFAMIKQDSLYSFPISTRTEIKKDVDVSVPREYRFYKLVIVNDANPPLNIESMTLRWVQKQLFFIGLDDQRGYRLFWGSPAVDEASYDIAKLIRPDNWFNQPATSLQISSTVQNTDYKPFKGKDDKSRMERNILVIVIILVVIVVAFFLFQLWKKTG